jgi:hypothetical protein
MVPPSFAHSRFPWRWMVGRATCGGCRALSLRSHSHPPHPGRAKTRPFPRRRWRDALFEGPFQSSFQACLYDFPQGGLGCFQLRASTSTAYLKIRLVWCARRASKGSCLAYPFTFCGAKQRLGPAVSPIAGAEPPSTSYPSFWCARSARKGDQQPSRPFSPHRAGCEAGWAGQRQDPRLN